MPKESHVVEWIVLGIGIAFFALMGALVLVSGIKDVGRALASTSWPRVPAEVAQSEVTGELQRDPDGSRNMMYSARLVFAYEVAGQPYTTGQIRFGEALGSGDPSEPEMQRLRYPEGARVSVAYQPDNPAVAVARPGLRPGALVPPLAGVGLLLGAAFIFLAGRFLVSSAPVLPILLRLFVLVFILIGLGLAVPGFMNIRHAGASKHWPTTEGKVVFQQGDRIVSRWRDSEGRLQQAASHATAIVYSYEVDGITHFSNTRRWGQLAAAGKGRATDIATRYPVGAAVEVRYNSRDPDLAVLEPGLTSEVWWLPLAGLGFLLFGLAVWIWAIPALTGGGAAAATLPARARKRRQP